MKESRIWEGPPEPKRILNWWEEEDVMDTGLPQMLICGGCDKMGCHLGAPALTPIIYRVWDHDFEEMLWLCEECRDVLFPKECENCGGTAPYEAVGEWGEWKHLCLPCRETDCVL